MPNSILRSIFFVLSSICLLSVLSCKKKNKEPNAPQPISFSGDTTVIWTLFDETGGDVFNRITDIEQKGSGDIWVSSFNESNSTPTSRISAFSSQLNLTGSLDSTTTHFLKGKVTSIGFNLAGDLNFGTLFENTPNLSRELIVQSGGTFTNFTFSNGPFSDDDFEDFHFNTEGLWFGAGNEGLVNFNNSSFTTYTSQNSNVPPPGTVKDFVKINTFDFWFITHTSLVKKTGSSIDVDPINIDPDAMDIDSHGNLWLVADHNLLYKYDGNTTVEFDIPLIFSFNPVVSDIVCDDFDNIWVATGSNYFGGTGLYKFNGVTWSHYTPMNSGLHSYNLSKLKIDADGNLWIGSIDAGLVRLNKFGTLKLN